MSLITMEYDSTTSGVRKFVVMLMCSYLFGFEAPHHLGVPR
jgi:hypothetical protein